MRVEWRRGSDVNKVREGERRIHNEVPFTLDELCYLSHVRSAIYLISATCSSHSDEISRSLKIKFLAPMPEQIATIEFFTMNF